VPAGHKTAVKGRWVKGPGTAFFRHLLNYYSQPPIVVEDLGEITPAVRELIREFSFPTMKVLQFAFDGNSKTNVHLPHNHCENAVVYTGTHDNNTTRGWYRKDMSQRQKKMLTAYTGKKLAAASIHWDMIQMAMKSVAELSIIPMQDLLGLDEKARMNNPARTRNNWRWRMRPGQLKAPLAKRLRNMIGQYGRL
jgi:4-alpha-glucanotransferase